MAAQAETVGSNGSSSEQQAEIVANFQISELLAEEIVSAASKRWYFHSSRQQKEEFETSLRTVFDSPNESSPSGQTLALAGLWAKQLTCIDAKAGPKIFVRFPHHGETGCGLHASAPEKAVEEIIVAGVEVLQDEIQATEFSEWLNPLLAKYEQSQAASVSAGAVAVSGFRAAG